MKLYHSSNLSVKQLTQSILAIILISGKVFISPPYMSKLLNMHNDSYAANRTPVSIPMNFFSIPLNGKCLNSPPTIELG